jgi:hypothetical protein
LTFLGYTNDLAPGNAIPSGTGVSPGGNQPVSTTVNNFYGKGNAATHSDASNFVIPLAFATIVLTSAAATITLPVAGKWLLFTNAVFGLSGSDGGSTAVVSSKLARTNNTPGDIVNSQLDFQVGLGSAGTISNDNIGGVGGVFYQGSAGDVLALQVQSTIAPSSGVFCITYASIVAIQIG